MSRHYWFYIDSFVHISVKDDHILFYNPYTGKILEFQDSGIVSKLMRRLLSPRNLQVIRLSTQDLEDSTIHQFVQKVREYFMGDLIAASSSDIKPFQMPPLVKIQKDVKNLKIDESRSVGENIMDYLDEITIYLNDSCQQACGFCSRLYRQVTCCTSSQIGRHLLDINKIETLFHEIQGCMLTNINITGGDIFTYPYWNGLDPLLKSLKTRKTFYLHYLNAAKNLNNLYRLKGSNQRLKMLVTFPLDIGQFKKTWESVANFGLDTIPVFIIQDNEEFQGAEELISGLALESPIFLPFFNGKNLDFFEENFFISREDIEAKKPTLRDIYINGTVNLFYFGKITVLASGAIHAGINFPKLGTLGKGSLYECIFREMKEGRSWRKIRKNVLPCKKCNFEKLCPPICDYNIAVGKYDLCKID